MSYLTQALKLEPHHARAIEGRIQVKVMKRTQVRR
jgi:hypothetical protein